MTGLERVITAYQLCEQKLSEGYSVRVIFTGGWRGENVRSTSEVMSDIFNEMYGRVISTALGNSRETRGNTVELFETLEKEGMPTDSEIVFVSQAYHNVGDRFERLLRQQAGKYTSVKFQAIEELGIDLGLSKESWRFRSKAELLQALVIQTGHFFDKILFKRDFKIENLLYNFMSGYRKSNRDSG